MTASMLARLAILCAALAATPAPAQEGIAWRTDHAAALAEARAARKPVFVDLWATWCAPCKVMEQEVYPDARVVEASRTVVMVKVDVDKDPETTEHYGPDGIPTAVFVDPFGNEIVRREGMLDADRLSTLLGQLPASYADAPAVFETLGSKLDDHATLMQVAHYYVSKQAYPAALVYFERAGGTALARKDAGARGDTALGLGMALLNLDAPELAEKAFRDALKKPEKTREPMLRFGLGSALQAQGKDKDARKEFERVLKRHAGTEAARLAGERLRATEV